MKPIEIPDETFSDELADSTVYYFYRCRRDKLSYPATPGDVLRALRRNKSVPKLCSACHKVLKLGKIEIAKETE